MKHIMLILIVVSMVSCQTLDTNLFNADNSIKEYKLDRYDGEVDFYLDDTYKIHDSMIHRFTVESRLAGESSTKTIHALYLGDIGRIKTDTVIIYCHGNKDHMDFYWQRAKLLANTGYKHRYGVVTFDYRGYGLSEGEPTESGLIADLNAVLVWMREKGLTSERCIMYGFSVGSVPAVYKTAEPEILKPSKLILEAPLANIDAMVQDAGKLSMHPSFYTHLEIQNSEKIKKADQPLLWIHGTADEFVSMQGQGAVVFRNHQGIKKQAVRVDGADHDNVPQIMGFRNYCNTVNDFIVN